MKSLGEFWERMTTAGAPSVLVSGVQIGPGSRVRLRPRAGGDVFDLALAGKIGIVEGIDEDQSGGVHVAVTLEDDPGRDLGDARHPGHRFFFRTEEIEPLESAGDGTAARILVAGLGNVFLGDDGFGVEVAARLAGRPLAPGVDVVDFGIRGVDLVYALQERYAAAILVDAVQRGEPPGTLYIIDADDGAGEEETLPSLETHGMEPSAVLRFARRLGPIPSRVLVVGCEPASLPDEDVAPGLSTEVADAVDRAVELVGRLVEELRTEMQPAVGAPSGDRFEE